MTASRTVFLRWAPACAWFVFTSIFAHAAVPVSFDIPAQPAPAALRLFTKQSGAQVVYLHEDLRQAVARAVKGELLPAEALRQMLAGSGLVIEPTANGNFALSRSAVPGFGAIEGSVIEEKSRRPLVGARVAVVGTDKSVVTDRRGRFRLEEVPPGEHRVLIQAEGRQDTRVTEVEVAAGHRLELSAIAVPAKQEGPMQLEPYTVSAKKNDGVVELDPFEVAGRKERPFVSGNMDIPRTINDAQPYVIYDLKAIAQSGAANVEDFLKQRLTMNSVALTNSQNAGLDSSGSATFGNTSAINLRGLGADKTLVLINGRRSAGVSTVVASGAWDGQPDLNAIPVSAIERIEVLPSSASGIYGGSAIGGVVNVILRRDYRGGELSVSYGGPWDADAPQRMVAASYGMALEGGRTHVLLNAHWADASALLFRDRRGAFERALQQIRQNAPSLLFTSTNPFLGALPNIAPSSSTATNLTLKAGGSLGSRNTYVPAGTMPGGSPTQLAAGLLANAGAWNFDLPDTNQGPTGLRRPLGVSPETKSFAVALRRQLGATVELFADFGRHENRSASTFNPQSFAYTVPAAAPTNPFTAAVRIRPATPADLAITAASDTTTLTLGAVAQLPAGWMGEADCTVSRNEFDSVFYNIDDAARNADLLSGALNPFVDPRVAPLAIDKYFAPVVTRGASQLRDFSLRGTGPLPALPWGSPSLAVGLGYRLATTADSQVDRILPLTTAGSNLTRFYARDQETGSAYGEVTVPLLARGRYSWMQAVDLQVAGRSEHYAVDSGTISSTTFYRLANPTTTYAGPTRGGQPYFSRDRYASTNYTVGLKLQPVRDVILRASRATAFLPPAPEQLVKNPEIDPNTSFISDPKNPTVGTDFGSGIRFYEVNTISGGNPELKPQSSESWNAGLVWEPQQPRIKGLRANLEYYSIRQSNAVGQLGANVLVELEAMHPDRIVRNSANLVTLVDVSAINLYRRETSGWDLNLSYSRPTAWGDFSLQASGSLIRHLLNQYSPTLPVYDAVDFPAEGGAASRKAVVGLRWDRRAWSLGWSVRFFGHYRQSGAAGGPNSVQFANGGVYLSPAYITAQGSDTIPSQLYHDAFLSYEWPRGEDRGGAARDGLVASLLAGLSVQLVVTNVFAELPPVDVFYAANYYLSPYGDLRQRTYSLRVTKRF
ncbi:MAG: TonB-dependent receptor plug domain-containing protein [Opitutaceae bacterium]|nr:TonB-dependent receptor plug domain-containing protein [Opitutaceae bacterium]